MGEFWIKNATFLTQNDSREIFRGNCQVIDGKIAALTTRKPKASTKVIDASGLTVLPGFVQTHIHLCQTLFRNLADDLELLDWLEKKIWPFEASHTEESLHLSAELGIYELLSSGTTCILDMGTVRHTEVIVEAIEKTGIRANLGKCLMDHPETTPAYLRESTDKALAEAQQLFEKFNGSQSDRIRISYAPRFVISSTERLLREVHERSQSSGALIHTHASENRREIEKVKQLTGFDNIEYLQKLSIPSSKLVLAHCIWLNENEIEVIARTHTNVTHCPSSNLKLASGFANVPVLLERGVNVCLGADGAPCNNNLNMFSEMKLAALIHKPQRGPKTIRAQEALDMATRNGAKALNWFDDIGSIEVGKKADLIAIDLNRPENLLPVGANPVSALVYSGQPSHVSWTMVDGKLVYSKGRVKGIQLSSLLERARSAQKKILRKVENL